jgi:LCP family protein required for cell wall assembly
MGKLEIKRHHLKGIAILLAVVLVISAALMLLEVWENSQDKGSVLSDSRKNVTYEGKEYVAKDNIETLLMLGLDKYEGQATAESHESGVQTDFLMLFVFDNKAETCTAIQINRDTMTKVKKLSIGGTSVVDTYTKQVALAYNYVADDNNKIRCRNTKDSVEEILLGIDIDHYLALTMDAVPTVNDLVGGVELEIKDDFSTIDASLVKGEKAKLTGEQALLYVRARKGLDDDSNLARMERQRQYINTLYEKLISKMKSDDEFIATLAKEMNDFVVYDSSNQKMQRIAEKFDTFEFLGIREIEGESKLGEEFMEFYPNEDSVWENVLDLFYLPKVSEQ